MCGMKKAALAAIAMALTLGSLVPRGSAGEEDPPAPLVPNLRPLRAVNVHLERSGRSLLLRFTTNVLNRGKGPLELRPTQDECGGHKKDYTARQHVYLDQNESGSFERGEDTTTNDRRAGCFTYHKPHDHWHFRDFADYVLLKVRSNGTLKGDPVARSDKVSFCMLDTRAVRWDIKGKPEAGYYKSLHDGGCTKDDPSGISIGWLDHYGAELPGQALNVTRLRDGRYCLSIRLDPRNRLKEINDSDNVKLTWLRLEGGKVRVNRYKKCPGG